MATRVEHFLEESAASRPDAPALRLVEGVRTYAELAEAARRLARRLVALGVVRGDRVVLLRRNGFEYAAAYYGILSAGAVCVSLEPAMGRDGLEHILADCKPAAVVHGRVAATRTVARVRRWPVETRVLIHAGLATAVGGPDVVEDLGDILDGDEGESPLPAGTPEDLAAIVYTSGSTGRPKGAMLTHANLVANTSAIVEYLGLTSDDSVLAVLPFSYVYGKTLLNTHIAVGAAVVVENRFAYPNVALQRMRDESVTGLAGVPSTFNVLLKRTSFAGKDLPALRYVTQAGGAMAPAVIRLLMDTLPERRIFIMYGATEASARLSYLDPEDLARKVGSIGKPLRGVDLHPVRPDGSRCDPGEEGELVASGPNIMQGYWNDPEETARVLRDGVYHTGDLGYEDEEGFLYVVGRSKSMLKVGGRRVSPQEIEDALGELADVVEAAVIGTEDVTLGEAARAFVVLQPDTTLTLEDVERFLRKRLPPYKVPRDLLPIAQLPKNASGKVLLEKLREIDADGAA